MTDMILRAEADARVAAVIDWYDGLVGSSTGVAGYHVNGAVAGWGEFDRPTCPEDARAALEAMLAEAEKRGEKRGMLRAAEIAEADECCHKWFDKDAPKPPSPPRPSQE